MGPNFGSKPMLDEAEETSTHPVEHARSYEWHRVP
jgi:hypothetical protein